MQIYLAGSIPKGDEEAKTARNWRDEYVTILREFFAADFIYPMAGEVDETDVMLVLGKDSRSIKISDLVIVNAEERLGAGTAMELVIAKYLKKPVITVIPKDTHHRRSNLTFNGVLVADWIHPFIAAFSDAMVERVEDIKQLKDTIFTAVTKDITVINQAITKRETSL
jgi:hypothetical protein